MDTASLGYRTDLMLLELSGSELTDRGEYVVVRTPANPTFWWGNYLLFRTAFAPGDTASRLELFHHELPDAKHVALGIDSVDGVAGVEDELVAAGLEIERSTVMTASQVKEPTRPNTESAYRSLQSDDDWEQLVELTMAAIWAEFPDYADFTRKKVSAERVLVEAAMQSGSARMTVTGCRRRSGWSPTGPVWRGSRMCRPIRTIVAGVWPARSCTRRRHMG